MTRLLFTKFPLFKIACLCAILATDIPGSGSSCSNDLGMESKKIKNSQLSSSTNDDGWDANKGRLRNSRAWCSESNNPTSEYFQIDLLRVRRVSAIATQGVKHLFRSYYVETYMIKYSYDGATWFYYEAENGADVTFTGNSNTGTIKRNSFRDTFVTRYLRICPKMFHRDMCLRVEVYGCSDQDDDCSRYIASATGSITSPGHPVSYPSNKDCTWVISVGSGKQFALMFTTFDVKRGSSAQGCQEDFVEVRNGLSDISHQIGGKYCNGNTPVLITTTKDVVRIHFHSGSTALSVSYKGFQIHYVTVTPGSDDVLAGKGCDGDTVLLNCTSSAYTINILHASYGSYPYSCGQQYTSIKCPVQDVKSDIVTECQDYKECRISLSGGSLFGYSCPENPAKRQLEVFYQCTSRNIKTPAPTTPSPLSTQGSTAKAPITVPPTTINSQTSNSFTDETTGSTLVSSTEPFTTKPTTSLQVTPVVFPVSTDIPPLTTPGDSGKSAVPSEGEREAQTGMRMSTGTMAGVIVVAVVLIVVAALIALFVWRKRQHKSKGEPLQVVTFTPEREYSMPENCPKRRCPLDASKGAYDTVNILYESADSPSESSATGKGDDNAYASCPVPQGLPKITENPLYNGVSPPGGRKSNEEGYELVKPSNVAARKYESPSDSSPSKVKSIENPNYEKTLELKNHEYATPDCQVKPSC